MNLDPANSIIRLEVKDRARLGEAFRMLLDRGSILGGGGPHGDLYHWTYINREWMEEVGELFDLQLIWEHDQRFVQAIPRSSSFMLHLRLDATLVLLTLWYEFDSALRDRAETPPILLTVEQLNDSLRTKFEPLKKAMPSPTRLVEILRLAQRKNLVRFIAAPERAQTRIEILSTIKRVIPFQNIDEWTRHADRYLNGANAEDTSEEVNEHA